MTTRSGASTVASALPPPSTTLNICTIYEIEKLNGKMRNEFIAPPLILLTVGLVGDAKYACIL